MTALLAMVCFFASGKKEVKPQWPDGSTISEWFTDTAKIDVKTLGKQYVITKYGRYEVKYGHVFECYVGYGQPVLAGQPIAMSGDFLHFEVSYAGEVLDPKDFIGVLYSNVEQLNAMGQPLGRFPSGLHRSIC